MRWHSCTLLLAVTCVLVGCRMQAPSGARRVPSATPPSRPGPRLPPGLTAENYPKVDGSTSTVPLAQLIAARALGLPGFLARGTQTGWGDGGSAVLVFPLDCTIDRLKTAIRPGYRPAHLGTHQAYAALLAGMSYRPELLLEAREPSADELAIATKVHKQLLLRPIALDAFVFLVNASNPVTSLTLDQVRAVYTGQVTNWKSLGGQDEPIRPFIRDKNSGSQELMDKLVLKGQPSIKGEDMMLTGMMGPIERVSRTGNAIAYSVYYYEHVMAPNSRNRLLAIDGVAPSRETIANHRYPLVTQVYLATVANSLTQGSPGASLADWLLSADGQQVVGDSGYVPVGASSPIAWPPTGAKR